MTPRLAMQGLSFEYERDVPIFADRSEAFFPGEMVAITGPSGRGKSTLLYMLGLMMKPQTGVIEMNGLPVSGLRDGQRAAIRAQHFGFVFQDAVLDPTRSVLDNIVETSLYAGLARNLAVDRARDLMGSLGVGLRAKAKPGQVSGGQAQRIALCRALLNDPSILLADEPTGNLDSATSEVVIASLRQQAEAGATVIVVTHDPQLVPACDREVTL